MKKKKSGVIIAILVIILIGVISAFGYYGYRLISNDVNGKNQEDTEYTLIITKNDFEYEIGKKLYDNKVVVFDTVWTSWMSKHYPDFTYINGEYYLNSSMSYEEIADSPEELKCYGKPVKYRKIVDLTVADQAEPRRLTYADTKDLYQDEAYYIAGEKQDVDAIQASRYEENKENNKKTDNRGAEYPETPIYDGYGTDRSSTPTVSPTAQSRDEDEYHVNDYDDPEDFYEDNADDFEDEEDAEDYYDEYHE